MGNGAKDTPKIDEDRIKETAREILIGLCSNPMFLQLGSFEKDATSAAVSFVNIAYQLATSFEMANAKVSYYEKPLEYTFWMSNIKENFPEDGDDDDF